MYSTSGISQNVPDSDIYIMNPHLAAVKAIRTFKKGNALAIPGFVNKVIYLLMRHFPRRLVIRVTGKIYRPKYSGLRKED
jgi:short-subunit dehydrogenase